MLRGRVIVVEDDAASRKALALLLRHGGFEAAQAAGVAEAVALLEAARSAPDLPAAIVLDLMLPDGSGGEVLAHVRRLNLPVKVALATGAADWRELVDLARGRPDAVFTKPLDFPRLLKWIEAACE